jgi:hypothetical protein
LQSVPGGLPFNSKEIVFYKQACSNFIQANGYVSFDYNEAYITPNNEIMFWVDQTVRKLNSSFLNQNNNSWEQVVRQNLQPIVPPIEYVRFIVFTDGCERRTIRKRVFFKNARLIFQPTPGLVNAPIPLKITDF